jgi:hypothetical protein
MLTFTSDEDIAARAKELGVYAGIMAAVSASKRERGINTDITYREDRVSVFLYFWGHESARDNGWLLYEGVGMTKEETEVFVSSILKMYDVIDTRTDSISSN